MINKGLLIYFIMSLFMNQSASNAPKRFDITSDNQEIRVEIDSFKEFSFPPMELPSDKSLFLCWKSRIDSDHQRGGREFLRLEVNGKVVGAKKDRLIVRLRNKPTSFTDQRGRAHTWYVGGADGWLTPFSGAFTRPGLTSRFHAVAEKAYDFCVDVTDLMRNSRPNRIVFRNLMQARYAKKYQERYFRHSSGDLIIRNLALEVRTAQAEDQLVQPPPGSPGPWELEIGPSGGLRIHWGRRTTSLESAFADGGGSWTRLPSEGEERTVVRPNDNEWRVSLQAGDYSIDRTVVRMNGRIKVRDRFTLLNAEKPVPLIPRYRLRFAENAYPRVFLGGDDDPSLNDIRCPFNPTLFVPMHDAGLGLVLEDDVMRLQGVFSYDAAKGHAVVRSDELVLSSEGGSSYAIEMSLYPIAGGDYWTFLNRVRQDQGIESVLPGTVWFTNPRNIILSNPSKVVEYIQKNRVAYVVFWANPDPRHYDVPAAYVVQGVAQMWDRSRSIRAAYERDERAALERLHRIAPSVKGLVYVHSHVCSFFQSERLSDYEDSWIKEPNGQPIRRHEKNSIYVPLYYVYPTKANRYGKDLDRLLNHLIGLGADGVYWDEMPASYPATRCTYHQFDGFSADVDTNTQTVRRLKGLVSLLSADYKAGWVKELNRQGKIVHANGAPDLWSLSRLPMTCMVETKTSAAAASELHLATPYAYVWGAAGMDQYRERLLKGSLPFQPGPENGFVPLAFPMDIQRLGKGFIIGESRLVTAVDGWFGWSSPWTGILTAFDARGREIEKKAVQRDGDAWITVPPDGVVFLEKQQEPS